MSTVISCKVKLLIWSVVLCAYSCSHPDSSSQRIDNTAHSDSAVKATTVDISATSGEDYRYPPAAESWGGGIQSVDDNEHVKTIETRYGFGMTEVSQHIKACNRDIYRLFDERGVLRQVRTESGDMGMKMLYDATGRLRECGSELITRVPNSPSSRAYSRCGWWSFYDSDGKLDAAKSGTYDNTYYIR